MKRPKAKKSILGIPPKLITLPFKPIPSILGPHSRNLKATLSYIPPKPSPCTPLEPKPPDERSFVITLERLTTIFSYVLVDSLEPILDSYIGICYSFSESKAWFVQTFATPLDYPNA